MQGSVIPIERGLCQTRWLCGKDRGRALGVGRTTGAKLNAASLAQGARPSSAAAKRLMRRVRRAPTTRISACGLTLEFTCVRQTAKPAVERQVQRRVRPYAPARGTAWAMAARRSEPWALGGTVDVRLHGPHWRCWHAAKATVLRSSARTKKATGLAVNEARRRAFRASTLEAAPRAGGDVRCQTRTTRSAGLLGDGVWKGHVV